MTSLGATGRQSHASATTTAATVIHFAVVLLLGIFAAALVVLGATTSSLVGPGWARDALAQITAEILLFSTIVGAVAIAGGVALLRHRAWARIALVVVYAFAFGAQIFTAVDAVSSRGHISREILTFPLTYAPIAMLVLLLHPATARDFSRDRR